MHTITVSEWVQALRSGEFKQTIGHLRDEVGYCCLGVAAELTEVPSEPNDDGVYSYIFPSITGTPELIRVDLPSSTMLALDIEASRNGCEDFIRRVIDMNDTEVPFDEIADFIEKSLPADLIISLVSNR